MISCARLPDMRADNDLLSEPGRALTDEDHELCDSLDLPESLLILFASGLGAGYQIAANAAFVSAAPQEQRSQAFGLAQGGMSLGQGIVLIAAGAAADHQSPAWIVALCGTVGAVAAVAIAVSWTRDHRQVTGQH
jgi:MFS family permease